MTFGYLPILRTRRLHIYRTNMYEEEKRREERCPTRRLAGRERKGRIHPHKGGWIYSAARSSTLVGNDQSLLLPELSGVGGGRVPLMLGAATVVDGTEGAPDDALRTYEVAGTPYVVAL